MSTNICRRVLGDFQELAGAGEFLNDGFGGFLKGLGLGWGGGMGDFGYTKPMGKLLKGGEIVNIHTETSTLDALTTI